MDLKCSNIATIMNLNWESATSITMELTSYMSSKEHKTKIHLGTTVLFFIGHLPKKKILNDSIIGMHLPETGE